MKHKIEIKYILYIVLVLYSTIISGQVDNGETFKVVIDAGHGGKDHGCSAHDHREKDIVLGLALRLGYKLQQYNHDVEVLYTRERDVFIPLFKRIEIANKSGADLFLSLHCNYIANKSVRGTETYVMGLHKADENLQVAIRENASILMERNFESHYEGYDPSAPESNIMLSLFQDAHLEQSIKLASEIESSFKNRTKFKSRGVKQAGFVVLRKASMPSVLIEAGFLSNKNDADYMLSEKGQNEITEAIAKAFTTYKNEILEKKKATQTIPKTIVTNQDTPKVIVEIAKKESYTKVEAPQPKRTENPIVISHPKTSSNKQITPSQTVVEFEKKKTLENSTRFEKRIYRVQLSAIKTKPAKDIGSNWNTFEDVDILFEDGLHKIVTGKYTSLKDAINAKEKAKEKGYKGAFIVTYKGNQRVKT